ncbi:UxaA family hydrolase [Vibrio mangrovi]|uniref:Altronate dehydratase n=1 Tax=Vibrio mangrovi TaxID=474394 RepID=A0A1Y6IYY0_9VIBR|nr:altronate dehydratase family protein [Vibrio mangrovi]MDW6002679.1 altronate dehydratase family protein [Vibrio mangrovi]SMS02838.1 Altronate dehydratase [Vibrio mangrovi]
MSSLLRIHPDDNVAVALCDLDAGLTVNIDELEFTLQERIPQAHKVALRAFRPGEQIVKYGAPIGHTLTDIVQGGHVSQENLRTNLDQVNEYQYQPEFQSVTTAIANQPVDIYRRHHGQVGIRNELWIIPTVGCVNAMAQMMKKQLAAEVDLSAIDGVHVFTHQYGCSQLGEDHNNTKILLQNLVRHPNAGAVLVIGLGCENNQIDAFRASLDDYDPERVEFMVCQQHDDEVGYGVGLLKKLYDRMLTDQRQPGFLSEVRFGLECGGSDGFSGITANPLLGCFSDYLIAHGGTTVLTEVPEMFGAEHLLMVRCIDRKTFDQTVSMINDFKQYFIDHHQPIYENPSPGNKAGGISTLEEKSLGCTQKAGQSPVMDVLRYGERIQKPGLNLLSAPGNDAIATSALAMAGCHMVLFSTGRGTPYGGPVPTLKLATNSDLARRKPHWIDFNAGTLVEGVPMATVLEQFVVQVARFVSGEQTRNEHNDFREIAVFKSGVTL